MDVQLLSYNSSGRTSTGVHKVKLPSMICFRVTRFCNARCGFCLAPPDGGNHPKISDLKTRVNWLLQNGVKTIHFCGGEPTIHHDLPELIKYTQSIGGRSKLTTNGILMSDELVRTLFITKTEVKLSLHGNEDHHNKIVGKEAFNPITTAIERLIKVGVKASVQTTIVHEHLEMVDWIINFCLSNKIKKVSFLPFIPRGHGFENRSLYGLTPAECRLLRESIRQNRKKYSSRLDIRLLDFSARPIHVVEPDGRIVLEGATEARDIMLFNIPDK